MSGLMLTLDESKMLYGTLKIPCPDSDLIEKQEPHSACREPVLQLSGLAAEDYNGMLR